MASAAPKLADPPALVPAPAPANDQSARRPIIVKKVIAAPPPAHHGGAWKVAYADFVTAMMAFFLMLWLLGATNEAQRKGLADHFTPTLVTYREGSAGSDGLLGGSSLTEADNYPNAAGQTGTMSITIPRDATGGPREGGGIDRGAVVRAREERAQTLRRTIRARLERTEAGARLARQVRVSAAPEGVRIDLIDDADFSMFALGTTMLLPEARTLVTSVAASIADGKEGLSVRGHTDALRWRSGAGANNWTLSTGRAEATRRALALDGIAEQRFARIEGVSAREPLIADDPADPRNRRISILLDDGRGRV